MIFLYNQSEKKQILRRLNENLKAQSLVEEVEETHSVTAEPSPSQQQETATEDRPSSNEDRKKWDAAEVPVLHLPHNLSETCATTTGELMLHLMLLSLVLSKVK